jgi:hypothetical protein
MHSGTIGGWDECGLPTIGMSALMLVHRAASGNIQFSKHSFHPNRTCYMLELRMELAQ